MTDRLCMFHGLSCGGCLDEFSCKLIDLPQRVLRTTPRFNEKKHHEPQDFSGTTRDHKDCTFTQKAASSLGPLPTRN